MPESPASALYTASAYWSAAVHDFEHGGVNNDFLIKTAHPLAITYNDQSPLENHHLAAATLENLKPQHLYTPVTFAPSCCFTAVSLTLTCNQGIVTQAGVGACQCVACIFQGTDSACFWHGLHVIVLLPPECAKYGAIYILHLFRALRMLLQVALLRSEEFMLFRQNNTSMVLGTDMKKHFEIMSRFQVSCSSAD